MRSPVDFVSLQVDNITPDRYSTGVNVYSTIQVKFNSELNIQTIMGNILLLQDIHRNYTNEKDINLSLYERVDCKVEYKDKTVSLTPINQLNSTSRYIVYIPKNSIADFKGRVLSSNFISFFDTNIPVLDKPCDIIYPPNNSTLRTLDRVEFENVGADRYIVQISTNKDFEIGLYERIVQHTNIVDDFNIGDGSYYIRAKSTNGEYGNVSFFTLQSVNDAMITESDYESFQFEQVQDDSVQSIGEFPKESINVSTKSNLLYIQLNKIVDIEDIDFYDSGVFEKHIKDEDYSLDSIDGTFVTIHDFKNKCTYVTFIMDDI